MHIRRTHLIVIIVWTAVLWSSAHIRAGMTQGQDPATEPSPEQIQPAFTTRAHNVLLHVNVLDGRRDVIDGLPASAFEVYEDGVGQSIEFFELRDAPLAAGLLIDSSSSMITRQQMVRAGVDAFAALSEPSDELFTIVFNEHVRLGLPPGLAFTRSPAMLQASLARARLGGKTALHDAVIEGLSHLEQATNQKRVLVVLSDGEDNASGHSARNMVYRAGQSSAVVHTIWSGDVAGTQGDAGLLRRLATSTGGVAYRPSSARDMVNTFETIARNIRRSYTIGYAPTNESADGTYRRIRVRVHVPGKRTQVLVRDGYTAPDNEITP